LSNIALYLLAPSVCLLPQRKQCASSIASNLQQEQLPLVLLHMTQNKIFACDSTCKFLSRSALSWTCMPSDCAWTTGSWIRMRSYRTSTAENLYSLEKFYLVVQLRLENTDQLCTTIVQTSLAI